MLSKQGKNLNITVLGLGYVGLSTALVLAYLGHQVTGLDIDSSKIEMLKRGTIPLFEPNLETLMSRVQERVVWSSDNHISIPHADFIFLCVQTPVLEGGQSDLTFVEQVVSAIALNLQGRTQIMVNKSTVPVGTGKRIKSLLERKAGRTLADRCQVVANPEFLSEGSALIDSLYPHRMVLGGEIEVLRKMLELYAPIIQQTFEPLDFVVCPSGYTQPEVIETTLESAEMTKYAANAFLALKISYANEMANLCEHVGADILDVMAGVGADRRIGPHFLAAGAGWGGSCLGKDTRALVKLAEVYDCPLPIISAAIAVNYQQRIKVVELLERHLKDLKGKRVALLGLSFKPHTDDLRDSPAHDFIADITNRGGRVIAHDPVAMKRANTEWNHLDYLSANSVEEALQDADACIIATDWPEYVALDWDRVVTSMKSPILIDARNIIRRRLKSPIILEQIGRKVLGEANYPQVKP